MGGFPRNVPWGSIGGIAMGLQQTAKGLPVGRAPIVLPENYAGSITVPRPQPQIRPGSASSSRLQTARSGAEEDTTAARVLAASGSAPSLSRKKQDDGEALMQLARQIYANRGMTNMESTSWNLKCPYRDRSRISTIAHLA